MTEDQVYEESLRKFQDFLSKQDKINYAKDLIKDLLYSYISWLDGKVTRCILSTGVLMNTKKYDAQLNIEVDSLSGHQTYVRIYHHIKGSKLSEGWVKTEYLNIKKSLF